VLQNVQTTSGAHPASSSIAAGVLSPEVEQLGCEADHSPPPHAKVKNERSCTSTPVKCLRGVYRDNFNFIFRIQMKLFNINAVVSSFFVTRYMFIN
jgi:hypothetical protein